MIAIQHNTPVLITSDCNQRNQLWDRQVPQFFTEFADERIVAFYYETALMLYKYSSLWYGTIKRASARGAVACCTLGTIVHKWAHYLFLFYWWGTWASLRSGFDDRQRRSLDLHNSEATLALYLDFHCLRVNLRMPLPPSLSESSPYYSTSFFFFSSFLCAYCKYFRTISLTFTLDWR